jgi:hypothetical protein
MDIHSQFTMACTNSSQWRMIPFLWIPKLSLMSQLQQLSTTATILFTDRLLYIIAPAFSYIASAQTAQRTPPTKASLLLHHATIARTQPQTDEYQESSWGKGWPSHKASPPSASQVSGNIWSLDVSQSYRLSRPVTGIASYSLSNCWGKTLKFLKLYVYFMQPELISTMHFTIPSYQKCGHYNVPNFWDKTLILFERLHQSS